MSKSIIVMLTKSSHNTFSMKNLVEMCMWMAFAEGSMCEHPHGHGQSSLNSNGCGMLYANQVLKKDSGVIDVLGHARELGKTGIGPFSRVKRVASYDFSPRRSRELHSGFVHIVVGGRIVTNPGTDS